jgi:hypothetical protein
VAPTVDVDALVVDDPVAATQITTARLEAITPTTKPSIASPSPQRPWTGGAGLPAASGGGDERPTRSTGGGGRPSDGGGGGGGRPPGGAISQPDPG